MFGKKNRKAGGVGSQPGAAPGVLYLAELNAKLRPLDRGDVFEDPLDEALKRGGGGEVTGGGTLMSREGEVERSDIEITMPSESPEAEATIIRELERLGAPKGSHLVAPDGERRIPFGVAEGLGVYLDGTGLPDSVYAECDVNLVIQRSGELIGDRGRMLSYWEGPTETALYFYGTSFQAMAEAIAPFVAEYPLLQGCRIVQIA